MSTITAPNYTLYHGDCLEYMGGMAAGSVDLCFFDPPYLGVLDEQWDNQWRSKAEFLAWLSPFLESIRRVLKGNGSIFVCAYPKMAAHVELEVGKHFNVLNSIVWEKSNGGTASRNSKEALRAFVPMTERIIFAEPFGSDKNALGESGYNKALNELNSFVFEPLRKYLADEFKALGWNGDDLNRICGTASMAARHFTARSQWCMPTQEHYLKLQGAARENGLRREYDGLRREYDDLRRPFYLTNKDQWSDVWRFNTSANEGTHHPAQKPLALLRHVVRTCTKPDAVVLDPMFGSCTTGAATLTLGRRFIGCELDPGYFAIAQRRIEQAAAQPLLLPPVNVAVETQLGM